MAPERPADAAASPWSTGARSCAAPGGSRRRRARRATAPWPGVDEVGRGALCGPVVACAVILGDGLRRRRASTTPSASPRGSARRLAERVRDEARACARSAWPSRRRSTASTSCARPTWPCSAPSTGLSVAARPAPGGRPDGAGRGRPPAGDREGRRALRLDRGGLHRGQGRARRDDARVRPAVSGLRAGPQHGLRERRPPRRAAAAGAVRDPPALFPRDAALVVLGVRGRQHG